MIGFCIGYGWVGHLFMAGLAISAPKKSACSLASSAKGQTPMDYSPGKLTYAKKKSERGCKIPRHRPIGTRSVVIYTAVKGVVV